MARKKKPAVEDVPETPNDDELEGADDAGDDAGDDPALAAFIDPGWRPPPAKPASERKVTNKYIPLFPDATKDPKRHGVAIRVYKSSPPGDGYKGTIDSPETVDESFLASLYGDGIFKLELLDQMKNVLRTRDNVKIAVGGASSSSGGTNGHSSTDVEAIVAKLTAQSEATLARVLEATEKRLEREEKRLADERAAERARSTEHTGVMTSLVKGEAEQLRAHYAAQQAASDKGAQVLLAMMAQGHQQNMQMMMAMQQAQQSRSDPLLFLKVFQEGMHAAPEGDGAANVTGNIVKGLESLRGLAGADPANQKRLPAQASPGGAIVKKPNPGTPAKGSVSKEFSKEELKEMVLLKRVLKARGMSDQQFLDLVREAKANYADENNPVSEEIEDDEDDEPAPPKKRKKKADDAEPAAEKPADDVDGAEPPDA